MRHCRDDCKILAYIPDGETCPILEFKKTRKESEWYFVKDGEKLIPMCEEKHSKTSRRKGPMAI